jgi:hypothetical protein
MSGSQKVVKSSCRACCVCCRRSETGSVDAMVLMGDSLIAEAARKVWAMLPGQTCEVWGEARRKVSVLVMDGLREPAEALKKNITQGAAQGGGSDALAISKSLRPGFPA